MSQRRKELKEVWKMVSENNIKVKRVMFKEYCFVEIPWL